MVLVKSSLTENVDMEHGGDDRPEGAAPDKPLSPEAIRALEEAAARRAASHSVELPPEIDGRDGAEATRFGDWEKKGLAIDF
ncbi:DUF1674 domain-containing protein [bacterium]|nr:DUF1674 domain-containing protein [bacterium]